MALMAEKQRRRGRKKKKDAIGGFITNETSQVVEEEIWIMHYSSFHQILLVGEGDFSFSLSLANSFGSASNIITTSLDQHDDLIKKYGKAKSNLETLVKLGATVLHGIDATTMKLNPNLSVRNVKKFDRIIFNFPHAGFHGRECEMLQIELHRNLVQGFFKNASKMLKPFGEVHVSHKTAAPYHSWNLGELALKNSLTLTECVNFERKDYPGYNNKRGDGPRCDEPFRLGECSTFKFSIDTQKEKKILKSKTRWQSLLEIPETGHTISTREILENQCGNARRFDGNDCLICYSQTYNNATMQDMSGTLHGNTRIFSTNDHLFGLEYQQMCHSIAMLEITETLLEKPIHPERNDCSPLVDYPAEMNGISRECLRIFGGYFRHNHEMFGRTDYDFRSDLQGFLTNGYEIYMNEELGRTGHGYIKYLEELHHLTILKSAQLRSMLLSHSL